MATAGSGRIIGSMARQAPNCAAVLDNVRLLHDTPSPPLDDVERVLTDGYACVLHTEGERLRLRGELEQRAGRLGASSGQGDVDEITALAQGIARADTEIEELRAALGRLAARVRGDRAYARPLRTA